jgi:hypothetical protein
MTKVFIGNDRVPFDDQSQTTFRFDKLADRGYMTNVSDSQARGGYAEREASSLMNTYHAMNFKTHHRVHTMDATGIFSQHPLINI